MSKSNQKHRNLEEELKDHEWMYHHQLDRFTTSFEIEKNQLLEEDKGLIDLLVREMFDFLTVSSIFGY
jgi:hypothetical protein